MGESAEHSQTFSIAGRFGGGGIYFSYREFLCEDVTPTIRRTARAITNLPNESIPDYYLPRKDVVQHIRKKIDGWSDHYLPTIVVYGPCGSGKSTAVQIAINQRKEKRRPVSLVRLTTADIVEGKGNFAEMLALKIIDSAIHKSRLSTKSASVSVPQGTLASSFLTGALRRVKQLPIIVLEVDVDVKFTSLQLHQLLVQLKLWSADSRFAQFIIVLSQAYTALGVGDLRSRFVRVNDLNDAEVQEFLQSRFPNISKGTIKQVHRRVGNRILHLQEVASITEALTQKKPTDRDLIEVSDRYADKKQREYTARLNIFLEKFATIPPPSLFETVILQKEQVKLIEFSKAFDKTMEQMVEVFLQPAPHPFYIDPQILVVTVGSHFIEKAIR